MNKFGGEKSFVGKKKFLGKISFWWGQKEFLVTTVPAVPTVTTLTIVPTVTTVTKVTNVITITTLTTIITCIVKYKMLLLYSSKDNFFTYLLQQTDQPTNQPTTRLFGAA